ncbi:sensor histidine kinase [Paenibacillus sp.]|uniref:cache domain-containing sensor histidine kinase n=1 Tax=Paenibacillus sp. TaxID=58172 RepID=UPI002D496FD9|nr:sensor histidine kinase [Paenibacillus sp.]HZG55716.1 sensor histidine kinase [Paenibacillus sp.]
MNAVEKMKALYGSLRIKYKMFLLIASVMLLVSVSAMAVFRYVFDVYDREIYAQASQALNVSSFGVENELRKLERLSFRLATDPFIQQYLLEIKEESTNYDQFLIAGNLRDRMLELGGFEKYVLSMQLHDVNGMEYRTGNQTIATSEKRRAAIEALAVERSGGNRWIYPDMEDRALAAAREVRSYRNLELDRIGLLAVRIDLENVIADYARGLDAEGADFLIFGEAGELLPQGAAFEEGRYAPLRAATLASRSGYDIVELDGGRYFMAYAKSNYVPWTYVVLMPYERLFQTTLAVKQLVVVLFAALFLLAVAVGVRFAKGVTGPIESLNAKMKNVQKGNFAYEEEAGERSYPMDETGQMHRNFRIMLDRINELINENFKKQLAIKESEFKALQSQINPHFLYNTLESINWNAKLNGQRDISTMVESLGFLLRSAISHKRPLIPLREELAMVGHYIAIQRVRYEERLDFAAEVPPELENRIVPKMTLQPIVENAIHYGVERMIEPCRIRIRAALVEGRLVLTVEDDGPGMTRQALEQWRDGTLPTRGSGIGLRNIDERIRLMFGEEYGVALESEPGAGTKATVTLPGERQEENGHV